MSQLVELASFKVGGGLQKVMKHFSSANRAPMLFSLFLPQVAFADSQLTQLRNELSPEIGGRKRLPVLYWLAGRGCSTEDWIYGTNFQKYANEHNFVVVSPDTSPRSECYAISFAINSLIRADVYEFEYEDPYQGAGASYYINAAPNSRFFEHYQMFTYVTEELPSVVQKNYSIVDPEHAGIFGHSMGGHGALIAALKCPDKYKSVSALAPLANIVNCGRNSMMISYLGECN